MSPAEKILRALERQQIMLVQDKSLPNVVAELTGEAAKGSWWSHPQARLIFAVLTELGDHPDVLFTKLIGGKVTLVHRKLWPAIVAIATSHAPWQLDGLSSEGRRLFATIEKSEGPVRTRGKASKELELRLLVHTEEVHSEEGRHELMAEAWQPWARRQRLRAIPAAATAQKKLERVAAAIGVPLASLPWSPKRSRS